MSTYVPSPSAPKAPRDQRLQFKGRNGVSVLSDARILVLTAPTPELMVEFFSARLGDAAPAWLCGPIEDVLILLHELTAAAEAEVARWHGTPAPQTAVPPETALPAPQDDATPCAAV